MGLSLPSNRWAALLAVHATANADRDDSPSGDHTEAPGLSRKRAR